MDDIKFWKMIAGSDRKVLIKWIEEYKTNFEELRQRDSDFFFGLKDNLEGNSLEQIKTNLENDLEEWERKRNMTEKYNYCFIDSMGTEEYL